MDSYNLLFLLTEIGMLSVTLFIGWLSSPFLRVMLYLKTHHIKLPIGDLVQLYFGSNIADIEDKDMRIK